jgi:hypothetical protein
LSGAKSGNDLSVQAPIPDFAALNPGYVLLKHQLAELEEAVCRDTQQKSGNKGCDICDRPNAMDELTHNTDSRLTPSSQKLRAFTTAHVLVVASAATVLL